MDNRDLLIDSLGGDDLLVESAPKANTIQTIPLKREMDSVDDFEHLGHDISPLKDGNALKGLNNSASSSPVVDEFDPLKVMDNKLEQIIEYRSARNADTDDKKDLLMDALSSPDDKNSNFGASTEQLEKYSDSEPDEDFRPSKYSADVPKQMEMPESFGGSVEDIKGDFQDMIEIGDETKDEKGDEKTPKPPVIPVPQSTGAVLEPSPVCAKAATSLDDKTEVEVIFCRMGLDTWFNPEKLNPQVEGLIYWRNPQKSGPVFGGVLTILLSLTYFSLISVVAYLSLLVLTATVTFRIYKNVVQAVQKTGDGHPFKDLLDFEITLSQDKAKEMCEIGVAHVNAAAVELRRLFLVEDLVDSIKFGVLMWTLTYLGAWFNGMTLIIIAWVALFTLPKVYEVNKTQIDANLEVVRSKVADVTSKVKAAIPIGMKGGAAASNPAASADKKDQ